jgi:hypothetical protein
MSTAAYLRTHVCGVATLPGDQAGVAFSPIWRLAMKIRFSRCTNNRRQKKEGIKNRGEDKFSCPLFFCPALLFTNLYWITTDILRPISLLQRLRDWLTPSINLLTENHGDSYEKEV